MQSLLKFELNVELIKFLIYDSFASWFRTDEDIKIPLQRFLHFSLYWTTWDEPPSCSVILGGL